jgi:hypothetical protein
VQKLDVVERLFPLVISGEKTCTVRFQERRMRIGPMVYWCDGSSDKTVVVWVKRCTDLPLVKAAEFLGKTEEWPEKVMLDGMRVHYPGIQLTDTVQVVEHYSPEESLSYLGDIKNVK